MEGLLTWMEGSGLARAILEHSWVFPALETLHFLGLILLIGSVYVIDLRVLGLASRVPIREFTRFIPVSLLGFGINLATGILFLFTDPFRYYPNMAFRLKMLAVLLAGLNVIWFKFAAEAELAAGATDASTTVRFIAGASLVLWTAVIVLGRMIPYME